MLITLTIEVNNHIHNLGHIHYFNFFFVIKNKLEILKYIKNRYNTTK